MRAMKQCLAGSNGYGGTVSSGVGPARARLVKVAGNCQGWAISARSAVAGAKGGLTACVAAELARPLRPGSRGEEIGSLDGLAALLASRWGPFLL